MPIVSSSTYRPPPGLSNGHLQTIIPAVFRRVKGVFYHRWRLETPDRDFLDIDRSPVGADRAALIFHGLEGSSAAPYVRGMVRTFNQEGWDALAVNFRGCSGEPNRRFRSYHSGVIEDIAWVVDRLRAARRYREMALVGFSLGGNVVLRYLGVLGCRLQGLVRCAAVVSAPCDLAAAARQMDRLGNRLYTERFLRTLRKKAAWKFRRFPGAAEPDAVRGVHSFRALDDLYTAPAHGFADAPDYWSRCSASPLLHRIAVPTLLLSARNDPFLAPECFPVETASDHPHLHLEMPASGGHVGFVSFPIDGRLWHEARIAAFFARALVAEAGSDFSGTRFSAAGF